MTEGERKRVEQKGSGLKREEYLANSTPSCMKNPPDFVDIHIILQPIEINAGFSILMWTAARFQ